MRLVVCTTYDQARNLKREFPSDLVVVEGARNILGYRYTEIIDRTYEPHRHAEWWQRARLGVIGES